MRDINKVYDTPTIKVSSCISHTKHIKLIEKVVTIARGEGDKIIVLFSRQTIHSGTLRDVAGRFAQSTADYRSQRPSVCSLTDTQNNEQLVHSATALCTAVCRQNEDPQ